MVEEKKDSNKIWTIGELIRTSHQYVFDKTNQNLKLDIELLLSKVLNCSRVELYTNYMVPVSSREIQDFKTLLKRRLMDEPLAYILGYKEFWKSSFTVNENTLIPRVESEFIVEKAIEYCKKKLNKNFLSVLDIGTGSGCLIISIALSIKEILDRKKQEQEQEQKQKEDKEIDEDIKENIENTEDKEFNQYSKEYSYVKISESTPKTTSSIDTNTLQDENNKNLSINNIDDPFLRDYEFNPNINTYYEAWDISSKALEVANLNANKILDKKPEIAFIEKDLLDPDLLKDYSKKFDIIVSNPPYIEPDSKELDVKSTKFEPREALFAKDFIFYRKIADNSSSILNDNGIVIVEIGINQKDKVIEIFEDKNFKLKECIKDYSEIDRVLIFSL